MEEKTETQLIEELGKLRRRMAVLHETALDLAAQRGLPDLLQAIVERAASLLGAKGGGLYLYRPDSDDLELFFTHNLKPDYVGVVLKRGEGLSGRVLKSGQAMVVPDYARWEGRSQHFERANFPVCVAVPILWGDHTLGVLYLADAPPRTFSEDDIAVLRQFAPLAGAALEQTRLLEEARVRWQEAETLRQAGAAVTEVLSLDERLKRILEYLGRVVPYDSACVQLLQGSFLEIVGGRGFREPEAVIGLKFPVPGDNPNTLVVQRCEPVILSDARSAHPPFSESPHDHIRSWLGVPLTTQDRVIGILAVDSVEMDHFTQEHVRLVIPFADQVAVAIENARLYSDLEEQLSRLRRTQAQLVQSAKLAAIGELAAGVAHELNNPLAIILGFAELLLGSIEGPFQRELEIIVGESQRARDIVRNLLDFSRQTKTERRPADVNWILSQTLIVLRYQLERRGITVEEEYSPDVPILFLDAGQIRQVLVNLVSNAVQAMPEGGTLRVHTASIGDEACISVSDTGIGIPPELQERVFDPFFSTDPESTGLGLSVSFGIVQEHEGRITVESKPGEGSTFKVWLPVGLPGEPT
jgi:signal transduction histidine kinase